jgi:hypothetical protein
VTSEDNATAAWIAACDRKVALKRSLAANLGRILKQRKLKITELTGLLNRKGAAINEYAVRAWLRKSERKPTLPSTQNLACLSEVLGIGMQELLGMSSGDGAFYQKLREPEDQNERDLLNSLSELRQVAGAEPDVVDRKPQQELFDALGDATDYSAFYYLLSSDLVRIVPQAVARDAALERSLAAAWERRGNGSLIDHACVYDLPGLSGEPSHRRSSIGEIVFFRCAAQYLIENVIRSGCTIGISGGKTMASVMKLLPRSENLRGCNFFPLTTPHSFFSETPAGSAAVIADLIFRYGDLGIRIPDAIDEPEGIASRVNVSDIVAFSLGGASNSSISNLLRRIRQTAAPEEQEKLRRVIAGDILAHVFVKDGRTIEEVAADPAGATNDELSLVEELLPVAGREGGGARFALSRKEYARTVTDTRIDLSVVKRHVQRPNRRTILIISGTDKLEIMNIFRERFCEQGMRFTLITEQRFAKALVEALR